MTPTAEDAASLASGFGLAVESARPAAAGFSGAFVFRVDDRNGRSWAARFWPDEADPRRVSSLHRFVATVAADGLGDVIAVPQVNARGHSIVRACGRAAQVEPWLPGQPADGPLNAAQTDAVAEVLARLHAAAARAASPGCPWFGRRTAASPSLVQRAAAAERLLESPPAGEAAAVRLLRAVMPELRRASREAVELVPCVRDLWSDSVLFEGDRVSAVIDLSAARVDQPEGDLARLFGSFADRDVRVMPALLDRYAHRRAFDAPLVRTFDRVGVALSLLLWRERIAAGMVDEDDPAVAARVDHFRRRVAALL